MFYVRNKMTGWDDVCNEEYTDRYINTPEVYAECVWMGDKWVVTYLSIGSDF